MQRMRFVVLAILMLSHVVMQVRAPRNWDDCGIIPKGYSCVTNRNCDHRLGLPIDCTLPEECSHKCDNNAACKAFIMERAGERMECGYGGQCVLQSKACNANEMTQDETHRYYEKQG